MELVSRDAHRNSPDHNGEALQVRGYADSTAWLARNRLVARRGDPRLQPDAGPLYSKPTAQSGQSTVNDQPSSVATSRPGSETSVQPSTTAQQSAVTPGLFGVVIVVSL